MNSEIKIRTLAIDELHIVRDLAHRIWPHTFKDILSPEQINYMLDWMYNLEMLSKQLSEGHLFFIAENEGKAIGFMGIQGDFPDPKSVKIHKIYVLPELQGKGIGNLLLSEAKKFAKVNDLERLILNVNRFNRAVEFYKHIGFKVLKEENIDIGNGYLMEDYVMSLNVNY